VRKEHVLIERAFMYDLNNTQPEMTGFNYDNVKGYWVDQSNNQPCIENPLFAAPRTKKADIETGEDRKGE
jgi:hypothetical protein